MAKLTAPQVRVLEYYACYANGRVPPVELRKAVRRCLTKLSETLSEKGLLLKTVTNSQISFLEPTVRYEITDAGKLALAKVGKLPLGALYS